MQYRAVIFDVGGVVVGSPLHAIAQYERDKNILAGAINRVIVETGHVGAWSRLGAASSASTCSTRTSIATVPPSGRPSPAREMMDGSPPAWCPGPR